MSLEHRTGDVSRLRIVHLANHCDRGGNVHVSVDLACVQSLQGHDVVFASSGGRYERLLEECGVRHERLVQNLRSPRTAVAAAWRLLELCRNSAIDLLHAHMMSGAVHGWLVSRLLGLPMVATVHNSFDRHSHLMRLADRVIAVSASDRSLLIDQGYPAGRVDVVLNGTIGSPRTGFAAAGGDIRLRRPCITSLCGLEKRKGVHDLIEAFCRAAPRAPDWHLYIAGDGPERGALEGQAHRSGFSGRIHFLGHVETPRAVLMLSDIFVLASYAEPFGLGILEAREAGCAVIATHVGGIVEQLGDGRFGRLVAPGDRQALAGELVTLMTDREKLMEGRKAAARGLDRFRVERMVCEYQEVYLAAIRSKFSATRRSHPGRTVAP